jgi:hypothetical protein
MSFLKNKSWFVPFLFLVPHILYPVFDDEEHLFAIPSTIVSLREIVHGNFFNLWTHDFGFGTPFPFAQSWHFHPFGWVWAVFPLRWAYFLFIASQYLWGAWGLHKISTDLKLSRESDFALHSTFMLCSTAVLCLVSDFWPGNFILWTGLPWIFFLTKKWIETPSFRNALAAGLVVGWLSLVCHIGLLFTYLTIIALYLVLEWRRFGPRHLFTSVPGLTVFIGMAAPKIYDLGMEKQRFPAYALPNHSPAFPVVDQLVSALFQPLVHISLHQPSRLLFMGAPLFLMFLFLVISSFRRKQKPDEWKLAACALVSLTVMMIPGTRFPRIFSGLWFYKDLFIFFALIFVLVHLDRMSAKTRRILLIAQFIHLAFYQGAYLLQGAKLYAQKTPGGANWMFGSSKSLEEAEKINHEDPGCWAWSPVVDQEARRDLPKSLGITFGSFAMHDICLRNHVYFKGISMDEIYPSERLMYGIIHSSPNVLTEPDLAAALGVKYLLAHRSEKVSRGWDTLREWGNYTVFKNSGPVTEASVVGQVPPLTNRPECRGIFCLDSSIFKKDLLPIPLQVTKSNGVSATINAGTQQFPASSFVLTDIYFRPGWQATTSSGEPLKALRYAGGLTAVETGTGRFREVRLNYRDGKRLFLRALALLTGVASLLVIFGVLKVE